LKFLYSVVATIVLLNIYVLAALADDNIANCEIVVQQAIEADIEEGVTDQENAPGKGGAQIATFLPAADFIFSVFDAKEGHMTEIDNKPIRAVMCLRSSVIPTEFDIKIIRAGFPFYLSPNFDAKDSALMAINLTQEGYVYNYVGPDLSVEDKELLEIRMELFNKKEDNAED